MTDLRGCPGCKRRLKSGQSGKIRMAVIVLLIALAAAISALLLVYRTQLTPGDKAEVGRLASALGVAKILPWSDRAAAAASRMFENSGAEIARNVQSRLHPTGRHPVLRNFDVRPAGEVVRAVLIIEYEGLITGHRWLMRIEWLFNRERSISVNVLEDTSPLPALSPMKRNLEHYFGTALYGEVLKTLD